MDTQKIPLIFKIHGTSGKLNNGDEITIMVPPASTLADAIQQFKTLYTIRRNNFTVKTMDNKTLYAPLWQDIIINKTVTNATVIDDINIGYYKVDLQDPLQIHFNEHLR